MMTEVRGEYYHEIHACISCLGFLEDGEYKKEPDVEDSIKDLLRYLRKERSDTCFVRREMGRANIVVSDLIPLLKTYPDEESLFGVVIRLLMNLTQPAIICFRNEVPTDKMRLGHYLELEGILRGYKLAFADSELMGVLGSRVSSLLEREWADRSEEDRLLIERILILVRNILHISQDVNNEKLLDAEVSLHDQVLWAMKSSSWDTLLLFLSNSDAEQSAFAFHTLEIMSLLFREQDPAALASAGSQEPTSENDPDRINLQRALLRETEEKRQRVMKESYRHNRFGGCYEIRGLAALSENRNIIYHHNPREPDRSFDRDKAQSRVPRNRAPRREREFTRRSSLAVRLFLRRLGLRFLEHCYNPLLRTAMSVLQREAAQENDETYYMWAMRFFMAFCRHARPAEVHLISETLNLQAFHWLFNQMTEYLDRLKTDRKKAVQWSRRLQLAVAAYREMLEVLSSVDKSNQEETKRSAHVLKSNVFYMPEYREVFPHLLKRFDQRFQNRSYLCDLVEGSHLLVKMLERHMATAGGALIVKKKKKSGGRKKKAMKKEKAPEWTADRLERVWNSQADALTACIRGQAETPPTDDLPRLFDPTSTDGEQDRPAALRHALVVIQDQLREEKPERALALLRLARELWPEEEALSIDDELLALRDIHMTSLPRDPQPDQPDSDSADEEDNDKEDREAARERAAFAKEAKFDMDAYVAQFAHPTVVEAYTVLLGEYQRNSDRVNAAIVRMLHRLAIQLQAPALLFQLRLFRVFQRLFDDPLSSQPQYLELRRLGVFLLRKFFSVLQKNEKVAVEVLFWKTVKESRCCEEGDYIFQEKKAQSTPWSEDLDDELRHLFDELKETEPEEFGTDTADLILRQFSDVTKTRRAIVRRLVHLRLIGSVKELKKKHRERTRRWREPEEDRQWTEEEMEELKEKVSQVDPGESKPLPLLRALLSFPVTTRQLKTELLRTGLAPPAWRLRTIRSGGRKRMGREEEEEVDERLLRDTSSSSSSEDEPVDGGDLKNVLGELVSCDLAVLQWLHSEISTLADTSDSVEDGLVLVAIEAEHARALETDQVVRILKALGLTAPDPASRYWRLRPALLTPGEVRERFKARLDWLRRAADGEDLTESVLNLSRHSRRSESRSDDSSDLSSLDESFLKRLRDKREVEFQSEESGEVERRKKKKKKKKKEESEETDSEEEEEPLRPKRRRPRRKKGKEEEEEEEEEKKEKEKKEEEKKPRRRKMIRISDIVFSDEEQEESSQTFHLPESDEETDGGESQKEERKEKSRRLVDSDDDEEEKEEEKEKDGKKQEKRKVNSRRLVDSDDDEEEKVEEKEEEEREESEGEVEEKRNAEDEEEEELNVSTRRTSCKRRRLAIDSDSENEDAEQEKENSVPGPESEEEATEVSPMPKKRRLIVSDSDDE